MATLYLSDGFVAIAILAGAIGQITLWVGNLDNPEDNEAEWESSR